MGGTTKRGIGRRILAQPLSEIESERRGMFGPERKMQTGTGELDQGRHQQARDGPNRRCLRSSTSGDFGILTSPAPCSSIAWCGNCCVIDNRSLEISMGYLNVMAASAATLLTNPWLTHNCHTIIRSHCWLMRSSTACVSVQSRYVGRASES